MYVYIYILKSVKERLKSMKTLIQSSLTQEEHIIFLYVKYDLLQYSPETLSIKQNPIYRCITSNQRNCRTSSYKIQKEKKIIQSRLRIKHSKEKVEKC